VVVTRFVAQAEEQNGSGRPVAEGELFWAFAGEMHGTEKPDRLVVSTVRGRDPFFSLPADAVADHRDHASPPAG
jgi:hypothetical protein